MKNEPTASDAADLTASLRSDHMPSATGRSIKDVVEPKRGFSSSRTILFTARRREGGGACERHLVALMQRDIARPLLADVFHQYRVMEAAGRVPGVKCPASSWPKAIPRRWASLSS